jgi:hypothetical protein
MHQKSTALLAAIFSCFVLMEQALSHVQSVGYDLGSQPHDPSGRRGAVWIVSGIVGFGVVLWAFSLLDRGYCFLGRLLIGLAILGVVSSGILFWVTLFPWSWDWWW